MHRRNGHNEILLPERLEPECIFTTQLHRSKPRPSPVKSPPSRHRLSFASASQKTPSLRHRPCRENRSSRDLKINRQKSFFPPPKIPNISRFPHPLLIDGKYSLFSPHFPTGKINPKTPVFPTRPSPPLRFRFAKSLRLPLSPARNKLLRTIVL